MAVRGARQPPWHAELPLRIGIHQDNMAVGGCGGYHRVCCMVLGLGVNIAARLGGRCAPGLILMSDSVIAQLRPRPEARQMGALELRGVPRPVIAFAVGTEG